MKRIVAVIVVALAAISVAACGSTQKTSGSPTKAPKHTAALSVTTASSTQTQDQASSSDIRECRVLKYDWNRTKDALHNDNIAYAGGGWLAIGKDFQALGMQKDYRASEDVGQILILVAEGQTPSDSQWNTLVAAVKQINADGSAKCGELATYGVTQ